MNNAPQTPSQTPQQIPPRIPQGVLESGSLEELLAIARARYAVEFEPVSAGGVSLDILQITNMQAVLDKMIADNAITHALKDLPLWAKIWPASIILGHYMRHKASPEATLLEVGAGCGVSGLMAAQHGFGKVVVSDINEDALLFSRINALKNNLGERVKVMRVNVANTSLPEKFDLIIGAEILYLDDLHRPLLRFISRQLKSGGQGVLVKDYRRKTKSFNKLADKSFRMEERLIGMKANEPGAEKASSQPAAQSGEKHLFSLLTLTPK